jgi:hypothetical protein
LTVPVVTLRPPNRRHSTRAGCNRTALCNVDYTGKRRPSCERAGHIKHSRPHRLGGDTVKITSTPGRGTAVAVSLSWPAKPEEPTVASATSGSIPKDLRTRRGGRRPWCWRRARRAARTDRVLPSCRRRCASLLTLAWVPLSGNGTDAQRSALATVPLTHLRERFELRLLSEMRRSPRRAPQSSEFTTADHRI